MSPYKMVYGKTCHLPLELEHKSYCAVKELNRDYKLHGKKRLLDLSSLDEWRSEAYENARLFKEKVKKWHDRKILKREFHAVHPQQTDGAVAAQPTESTRRCQNRTGCRSN
jgi:hypothetical protein